MGLITKTVKTKWRNDNKDWYENKGYLFTKLTDEFEIKIDDLLKGSNLKVKCSCDNCKKEYDIIWQNYNKFKKDDGKIYCVKCANKLYGRENARISQLKNGKSFEQWCIDNNHKDILDRWDYELNEYKPNEIGYGSDKKYWFKCPLGIHDSELKEVNTITSKIKSNVKCNQCNSIAQWLINNYGEDALEVYWGNKNTVNPFEIPSGSSTYSVYLKCNDCGNEKLIPPNRFTRQGLGCSKCSDGISFPNKIAFNLLEQLGLNFIPEYSPDWIKPKKYDFYFEANDKKYILEMDGGFHTKDNKMSGQTKEESKEIDNYKDLLATNHDIDIIRIDCNYDSINNRFQYIKDNILSSNLSVIFDLDYIDWMICQKYSCSSLVKSVCDYWNNGDKNIKTISNNLKLTTTTIIHYLNQGRTLGWCNYNGIEELKNNTTRQSKKVYCVELDKIYDSIRDAGRQLNIDNSHISRCCRGVKKYNTSGKLSDGTPLHWMYYENYIEQNN